MRLLEVISQKMSGSRAYSSLGDISSFQEEWLIAHCTCSCGVFYVRENVSPASYHPFLENKSLNRSTVCLWTISPTERAISLLTVALTVETFSNGVLITSPKTSQHFQTPSGLRLVGWGRQRFSMPSLALSFDAFGTSSFSKAMAVFVLSSTKNVKGAVNGLGLINIFDNLLAAASTSKTFALWASKASLTLTYGAGQTIS